MSTALATPSAGSGWTCKDRFDGGVSVMADYAVHWKSPAVNLVARHYRVSCVAR
jgi:hypothetical protein